MILRYARLSGHAPVFKAMTGLTVAEFDAWWVGLWPAYQAAEQARLQARARQRAVGAGHAFTLAARDQVLLVLVWLRQYPTHEVLGYRFGVSDTTVSRLVARLVPLLAETGTAAFRLPDPQRRSRRGLDDLLAETPALAVLIDSFEQRIQRPRDRATADTFYSGKKKTHTLKTQLTVDETTGKVVDVSASVPGPTNDLTLLKQSGVLERLPPGVGAIGDLGYVGITALHPHTATPRRKPRGQPRPPQDAAFNRAFASRRVSVEHTIGRLRHYQVLSQRDRHHRRHSHACVCAVAALANHQIDRRLP
jgi:hypothetical protein